MEKEIEKSLKILAIQMSSKIADKNANFSKAKSLIENNMNDDIDIIILPEVWTVGWKTSEFINSAENIENSETIKFLSKIAQKFNVNIIGGSFISKEGDKYYNTCPVINKKGALVATYNKMHLFSYYGCDEGKFVECGKNPVIVNYDLNLKEIASVDNQTKTDALLSRNDDVRIKIGLTICYDIRFPEIYRAYRKNGADLLINMAAWPMYRAVHWDALSKARAIENQCFMIALTQSGLIENDEWNLGHSKIIDYNGNIISEIDQGEGAMSAEIKFEEMYEFREKCTVLLDIHDEYEVKLDS